MKTPRSTLQGFSLVELVIAMGVTAFCLLSILGLLTIGLQGTQTSGQQTSAVGIASDFISDIKAASPLPVSSSGTRGLSPRYGIEVYDTTGTPAASGIVVRYLDSQGVVSNALTATSLYRVTLSLTPPTGGARTATMLRLMVTWPAQADPAAGAWPSHYQGSWETVVGLDQS